MLYLFRYFQVVPPMPSLLTGSLVVATTLGLVEITVADERSGSPLVAVLVLQAFSASTGFAASARRGYFDVLIARGEPRLRIACAQWLTAIAPGLASWGMLVLAGMVWTGRAPEAYTASGTAIAFLLASTVPWAATVPLPRFSGAIGWLLLVCLGSGWNLPWPPLLRDLFYPIAVVGHDIRGRTALWAAAWVVSVAALTAALTWVHRCDVPLESAQ